MFKRIRPTADTKNQRLTFKRRNTCAAIVTTRRAGTGPVRGCQCCSPARPPALGLTIPLRVQKEVTPPPLQAVNRDRRTQHRDAVTRIQWA